MNKLFFPILALFVSGCVSTPADTVTTHVQTTTTTLVTTTTTTTTTTQPTTMTTSTTTTTSSTTTTTESTLPPQHWVVEEGVRVEEGVSPLVVKLDDGRLRMYVTAMGISSYTSSDGLKFTLEKKSVIEEGVNPAIVRLSDGRYRMLYNVIEGRMEDPNRKLYFKSSISNDGVNFVPGEGVRFRSQGSPDYDAISVPDIVELPDNRSRLYYTGDMFAPLYGREGNSVRSAVSSDQGWSWKRDAGVRLPFESMDPDVVVLPDGRYRMYYTTNPLGGSKDDQRVYSAISNDGLNFTFEGEVLSSGKVGLRYMDPDVVKIPEGYRMYFSEASGSPGREKTVIKSAVWKMQ